MPSRAWSLLPGYEIISRIGRGAGATISLAREAATREQVAIKHVARHGPDDDKFIAQAENEYEIAHQLNHPYLRRYLDMVRIRKWLRTQHLFLMMEYVDGVRLEDHRPRNLESAIRLFKMIAEGLHAMHVAGFVHADIKPNNILLCRRGGGIKIIDFGQSCPIGFVKARVQGTPDYMAPEQFHRKQIDQRTDVFNLGATMYWIVTGKFFRTIRPPEQMGQKRVAIESVRGSDPPHKLDPNIPMAMSRLIMECCAHQPDQRPRDMKQLISRMETIEHVIRRRQQDTDDVVESAEDEIDDELSREAEPMDDIDWIEGAEGAEGVEGEARSD